MLACKPVSALVRLATSRLRTGAPTTPDGYSSSGFSSAMRMMFFAARWPLTCDKLGTYRSPPTAGACVRARVQACERA
eukprot:333589-Pleurochrysis_carterae.AAC.2